MADVRPMTGESPRVHDRAAALLEVAGTPLPSARGGAVLALVEAVDPQFPPRVEPAGGGCGGGRRIMLDGDAVALTDGESPTHLLVRAVGPDGSGVLVLVERGERGVEPWPAGGTSREVTFRSVRLDADGVVTGVVREGEDASRR